MSINQLLSPNEPGITTLQNLSEARRLNRWMFSTIRPYIKGRVMEIGSGIGNISFFFIQERIPLVLSDLNPHYCSRLQEDYCGEPMVRGIYQMDLALEDFEMEYADLLESFDTVFALNVMEHIANDRRAVTNAKKLLNKNGHLILLVPAYTALYNGLDIGLEHWRRYNRQSLKKLLSNDFEIVMTQYFNLAGILGWLLTGSILKKQTLPPGQLRLYDKLVPLFRATDAMTFQQIGLSVIAIGKKK
jgi:SAM-dependent methyltransferase